MSLRKLTTTELQSLLSYQPFLDECVWATRRFAGYWATVDPYTLATPPTTRTLLVTYAKRINLSCDRVETDALVTQPDLPIQYAKLAARFDDLQLSETAPDTVENIFAALLPRFEALAEQYFDLIGEKINMNITGN